MTLQQVKAVYGDKKIYVAAISQEDTDAPTVTIYFNTIGNIVWARFAQGEVQGTLAGAFTNPTMVSITNAIQTEEGPLFMVNTGSSDDIVTVNTFLNSIDSFAASDNVLGQYGINIIKIEVYAPAP